MPGWYHNKVRGTMCADMQHPSQAAAHGAQHFTWPVRVYYEDTDSAGVVYYANYLRYFERARTEWLRAAGFEHQDVAAQYGVAFVVRTITADYLMPARLDDALDVSVELQQVGASQINLKQSVSRAGRPGEPLCEASVRLACVSIAAMKPVRIPQTIVQKIRPA